MDSRQVVSVSKGKLAGNLLLAVLLGTLMPLIMVVPVSALLPVLMLPGILAVRMQARVGRVPAAVLLVVSLASAFVFMGQTMMLMFVVAAALPAAVVIRGMARKRPFFEQLRTGVIAYGLGLVGAMVIAYLTFGGGMVAKFVDLMRQEFARIPDSALQPLARELNAALSAGGRVGLYTADSMRAMLEGTLEWMQQTYAQMLPGTLLSGALLSGVISVLWGNWTMARLGLATNESFIGMSRWFLPAQMTWGLLALWVAGFVLSASGYNGGATVYATVCALAGAAFVIQAMAALDRRMLRAGRETGRRRLLITLLCVAALLLPDAATVFAAVGVMSALFGSHGALRRSINGDQSDRDDPQE